MDKPFKLKTIITGDGSKTLELEGQDESYHSKHGALAESEYVFLRQGLDLYIQNSEGIQVFEMGFGTGLNALLAWRWADAHKIRVNYHAIEAFPLENEVWKSLSFSTATDEPNRLKSLHEFPWEREQSLSEYFFLHKQEISLEAWQAPPGIFDLIFYDAFGPRTQPQLWEMPALDKIESSMKRGSNLVTYCAQGQFRRNLKALGLEVSKLAGPPGKREMTRARKP